MKIKNKIPQGFTIVELIVVIMIIGILTAITVISYNGLQSKARDSSVLSDIDTMDALQTSYGLKNSTSGLAYYSGSGASTALGFTPSSGNVIDVVKNSTDYCIRGYNATATKNSINNAFTKESSSGVCSLLPASGVARGIDVVTIGGQTWMKYNLNVGTMIPAASSYTNEGLGSQVIQKHCKANDPNYCSTYGGQYSWGEATNYPDWDKSEGVQGICPDGFHIPTLTDFNTLGAALGGNAVAGGAMKETGTTHWSSPNNGATNSSNFTALPGGYADNENFYQYSTDAFYWTSTHDSVDPIGEAYYRTIWSGNTVLGGYSGTKSSSMTIRCIQN